MILYLNYKSYFQRVRDDINNTNSQEDGLGLIGLKRPPPASDVVIDPAKKMAKVSVAAPNTGGSVSVSGNGTDAQHRPLNKVHSDSIVNYLLRLACQVGDAGAQGAAAAAAQGSAGPTQVFKCKIKVCFLV